MHHDRLSAALDAMPFPSCTQAACSDTYMHGGVTLLWLLLQGVRGMRVGGLRKLIVPPELVRGPHRVVFECRCPPVLVICWLLNTSTPAVAVLSM